MKNADLTNDFFYFFTIFNLIKVFLNGLSSILINYIYYILEEQ